MGRREYPIARVRIYEAGQEAFAKYDGFGRYDRASALMQAGLAKVSMVDPNALGLGNAPGCGAAVPAAMHVGAQGLNSVICRPFLDTSQEIGLSHFNAVAGKWQELHGLGLGQETKLYQRDGTCNRLTGLESRFELPHNPMFALGLWRAEPGREHDWSHPPYTEIHFGIGEQDEWAVVIPYGAPMFLMRRTGAQWTRIHNAEKALRTPSLEGHGKGQRLLLWFGVLRGKLVLSTDGFADDVWVCDTLETVQVRQSKLTLWHNAGQWMMTLFPIKMAQATVLSPAIETGFATRVSAGEVTLEGRMIPVTDDAGNILSTVALRDDSHERPDLSETQRSWAVSLQPYQHRQDLEGGVSFETWTSPEWLMTQVSQEAEVAEGAEPVYHDFSSDALLVTGEQAASKTTVRYQVVLDNQRGQHRELAEYRRASVAIGWQHADGTQRLADVIDGQIVEPPLVTKPGGLGETRVNVLDPMLRLRDEKADGRTPVFDGWPVTKVVRWVLARCGVPVSEQDIEDLGTVLSSGTVEEPAWQVEPGRPWVDFLQEIARFDYGATVWFDEVGAFRKTCPHCREKRTAEDVREHDGSLTGACSNSVRWQLYTQAKAVPSPTGEGEVLELQRTRKTVGGDYANYVVVSGADEEGRPVQAVAFDAASLYDPTSDRYVGWRKMDVWNLPGYVTPQAANRLALERLQELAARPEHVVVVTPLLPEARVGQVLQINGGETVGVSGHKYRIEAVRHRLERAVETVAVTVIEGKWLG